MHGNDRDFCDKYALSWIAVTDACKKVADKYPDVVVRAAGRTTWAILDEEKFIQLSELDKLPHVARVVALRGGPLSPAARTLGSNIHVARGLIKNTTQGGISY